jgi:hypothetical protein
MRVKFITCIYSNLGGTDFGGRHSRHYHYKISLLSLLKMSNADFLCYTSEEELKDLENFFYYINGISKNQLKFKTFDLKKTKYFKTISKFKNLDEVREGDRCYEIQYNKFFWMMNEDWSYDYYYWIDAGLSHCGVIPDKYLINAPNETKYYNTDLFNNVFLEKLVEKTGDKILIIGKENVRNYWMYTIPQEFYNNFSMDHHIIGGIFGGKSEICKKYLEMFNGVLLKIIKTTKKLWFEENFMSLLYYNNKEMFRCFFFDTWWHENCGVEDLPNNYFIKNKSFYKVLEDIIS